MQTSLSFPHIHVHDLYSTSIKGKSKQWGFKIGENYSDKHKDFIGICVMRAAANILLISCWSFQQSLPRYAKISMASDVALKFRYLCCKSKVIWIEYHAEMRDFPTHNQLTIVHFESNARKWNVKTPVRDEKGRNKSFSKLDFSTVHKPTIYT